ncbi:MAG: hypothetical protein WBP26_01515 [Candidatus Saccharimonadales bacterium]
MTTEATATYGQTMRALRTGGPSEAHGDMAFDEVKPHFYASSRVLIEDVRNTYAGYRTDDNPLGLVDRRGNPFGDLGQPGTNSSWLQLERAMSWTAYAAFEQTRPQLTGCPYHAALGNLGGVTLRPVDGNARGLDTLREVSVPGGMLAPALLVNLLRRMPAMAAIHGADATPEDLARNSATSLLKEPLRHPQQWARAFNFTLIGDTQPEDLSYSRKKFFPDDLIASYTKHTVNAAGKEQITWAKPTEDFTLRANVRVSSRVLGSEVDMTSDHVVTYPIGTRLGDIKTDEPTIGCPGNLLAYDMWTQAINTIVAKNFWQG